MMYGNSQYLPLVHEMENHIEWRSRREMEFTSLSTSTGNNNADGEWHLVTAPRAVLQCERAMKRAGQQDQLEGEFYNSLPRAHFLRPGYFRTATESSAFSPYRHDLRFQGKGLQDQSPRDSGSYARIPPSSRPHPLAQPGFYSPKIPRSKHCEPALSTTKTLKGCSLNKNMKEFYSHTLPLPHSKIAVLKRSSGLCSKPQGIKTSVVEKPRLMRAVISQISSDSNQLGQQQYNNQFQHIKKEDIQNQCFSSQHQSSLNLLSTEVSRKEEFVWNHGQPQSNQLQRTRHQSSFRLPKCAQDSHEINTSYMLPQTQSANQTNTHLNIQSSCFCKLSLFNGNCIHNTEDGANYRSHSNIPQPINDLKDSRKKKHDSKDRKDSNDVGNNISNNTSHVDMNSRNVFGQPRVTATLRAACSPRPARKSTVVEDLKKLIVMDDITDISHRDSPCLQQTQTNSSPSEFMQDSASSSPFLSRHDVSRPSHLSLQSSPTVGQPMSAEFAEWDKDLQFDHGLLPLPNTDHDLDWTSLVNAAEAYEMQRMEDFLSAEPHNMLSGMSPVSHSPAYSGQNVPRVSPSVTGETDNDVFIDLPDQLSHLEAVLRRLSRDLLKEKKDKVALLAEVLKLRMSNQHLKEESWSANAQLHKICQIFNISMYGVGEQRK
ncbi:uncharacterized protein LOC108439598 isoform X1 [Pygocentrus nattereri]|uniref:Signal-induced proliferation-associated 1-like protein C-terminal domain-containing protein n=1 Tax=Pygocentrus nattereri TaxID=42514 RepID=A0A3B4CGI1_PYGNA|nr:uncharacterized protein LOC108439598 isoform X1 [Pygocentrus nattereri]